MFFLACSRSIDINFVYFRLYHAGLSAELYYVREGVINEYALNFVVPVPAHIGELHFSWQSLADSPVSTRVMKVESVSVWKDKKKITHVSKQSRWWRKRGLFHGA